MEGLKCNCPVVRNKVPKVANSLYLSWQPAVSKNQNLPRIKNPRRSHPHRGWHTLPTYLFICQNVPNVVVSVIYSLKHEFIKRKLAPKSKIQYIKPHQADQRQKVDLILHLAIPAPIHPPSFTQRPVGHQNWWGKLYSPDEFFRATLNIGAFKMRNDYSWLVFKESHHWTGHT